jgi:hypothetical protein
MRSWTFAFAALLLLPGCKKGMSKGARLASEKLRPHVAALAKVEPSSLQLSMDEELVRNLWFARARLPSGVEYRCFVDPVEVLCDQGEGTIFVDLVAHRRLGDNRGSIDDPAFIAMLKNAYALQHVWPDPQFPIMPGIDKKALKIPNVERPHAGGVFITLYGVDGQGRTKRLAVAIEGEGTAKVAITNLP